MIEKPVILITSIGRTGTELFAKMFAEIIPDCTSLHEPDIIKFVGVQHRLAAYYQQVRRAGFWRMILLKTAGAWTLVRLSDSRFLGTLKLREAETALRNQRIGFVRSMPGSIYVESNLGYYGLLDVAPQVFKRHRAIYIVRDGRDWVRSTLNWGEAYGKQGIRKYLSHQWPAASWIAHDPFSEEWHTLSRFGKLCWAWTRLNEFALKAIPKNADARVFHFEKIFSGEKRYQHLNDLVAFATSMPGVEPQRLGPTDGWLERKIHESAGGFPAWENWTPDQRRQFEVMCGPLMEKLGYAL